FQDRCFQPLSHLSGTGRILEAAQSDVKSIFTFSHLSADFISKSLFSALFSPLPRRLFSQIDR
ncbi:hypothetical protein, partial [Salinivibrio sp. HTSP]|uniref:hypothetical protein n=1 Tax=Salinivibrio sp. HTSP TaxID=2115977 RepID=UPI001F44B5E4